MHGSAVALAVALAFVWAPLWAYGYLRRFTAWLITLTAALLAAGITVWTDALAGLVSSDTGRTVLIGLLIASGIAFYLEAVRRPLHLRRRRKGKGKGGQLALAGPPAPQQSRDHHHRIRTPVIGTVFGTVLVLAIGSAHALLKSAGKATTGAGTALAQSAAQISSGKAAHAVHASQRPGILAVGVIILAVLIVAAVRVEKHRNGHGKRPSGFTPAQVAGKGR